MRTRVTLRTPERHALMSLEGRGADRLVAEYAGLLGRPYCTLERIAQFRGIQSLTVILPSSIVCLAATMWDLRDRVDKSLGDHVSLGFLPYTNSNFLSAVLSKQLSQLKSGPSTAPPMVLRGLGDEAATSPGAHLSADHSSASVHQGPLLISAHARPFCGVASLRGSNLAICSSPTGGRGAKCATGRQCVLKPLQKLEVSRLATTRLFFNGCSTATLGETPVGHPRDMNHVLAAFSGAVAEYIGNINVPILFEDEISWFLALSQWGYRPADCVRILDKFRRHLDREIKCTLVYFGDAANPPWLSSPKTRQQPRGVQVKPLPLYERAISSWLVLQKPGRNTGVSTLGGNGARRGHALIPVSKKTSLLVVRGAARNDSPVSLTSSCLPNDNIRLIGGRLSRAIAEARVLTRMPSFAELAPSIGSLEDVRDAFARLCDPANSHGLAPHSGKNLRALEETAVTAFDQRLAALAISQAAGSWNFQGEFPGQTIGAPSSTECPQCKTASTLHVFKSWADSEVVRKEVNCPRCLVVCNVPAWNINLRQFSIVKKAQSLTGTFLFENSTEDKRAISVALQLDGTAHAPLKKPRVKIIELPPRGRATCSLRFLPADVLDNFRRIKLFVASDFTLGFFTFARFL